MKLNYKKILFDIALGIYYLHSYNIIHGDIKPSNVLLFKDKNGYYAKISDFSLSYIFDPNIYISNKSMYTQGYKAPEVEERMCYKKSDIWALAKTYINIYNNDNCDDNENFKFMIHHMLEIDVEKRWSIEEVLNCDYFKEFTYEFIPRKNINYEELVKNLSLHLNMAKEIIEKITLKFFNKNFNEDELFNHELIIYDDIITYFRKIMF
jgi:serine/threonine protein kinase